MSRYCKVCWHPDRAKIEREIYACRPSGLIVADRSGISEDSLYRHRKKHMPALLRDPGGRRVDNPDQAVAEAGEVYNHTLSLLRRSEVTGDDRACLAALREVRRNIELFARLHGQLPPEEPGDSPQESLAALIKAVSDALAPFPEAARAVAASLLEKDNALADPSRRSNRN